MRLNKYLLLSCFFMSTFFASAKEKPFEVASPNGKFKLSLHVNDSISYAVSYNNALIINPSAIALVLKDQTLGKQAKVSKRKPVKGKGFNELTLTFAGNFSLVLRAYNEGVAYRFLTSIKDSIVVVNEKATFKLKDDPSVIWQETDNYTTWEGPYVSHPLFSAVPASKRATTPALFDYKSSGVKVAIAESDVFDYPGMYVQKQGAGIAGDWAKYPLKTALGSWGDFVSVVKERADFLARTTGSRAFPWRVIIATNDDRELLSNHLVAKLARPSMLKNTDWVKPGKAAWEWWHDAMLPGAPIPSGMGNRNTALYNYYVDFAAANKLEYLMIDAGWSNNYDVTKVNPKLDVKGVISRAKEKQVGVFLWCVATSILKDLDKSLDFIAATGAAGIKVDFFDRDDQIASQWVERIAMECAKRKLMVDFHGCGKPTGLEVTYPNIVNYEAVRGAESDKWDYSITPDHHLIIPFIRMLAGPFDYTPGAMRNKTKQQFKPIDPGLPSGQGTRCHELAMYVIYDQPLGMLADTPTEYMKYPDIMKYLSAVPTVADETKVLSAKVGEYALMAKRKGKEWFVGAMTNWNPKELELDFSFLPAGTEYKADLYIDGQNADQNAEQYEFKTIMVTSKTKIKLKMAAGGGAAAYIYQ